MQPADIARVQESFEDVMLMKEQAAFLFYDTLFTLDPSLKHLFAQDMQEQGQKLMASLAFIVRGLKQPEKILPSVQELACRHVAYGVKAEHYDIVGKALLTTLEKGLGDAWNVQLASSWKAAYDLLAGIMIKEAYN